MLDAEGVLMPENNCIEAFGTAFTFSGNGYGFDDDRSQGAADGGDKPAPEPVDPGYSTDLIAMFDDYFMYAQNNFRSCYANGECEDSDYCCAEVYMSNWNDEVEFSRCVLNYVVDENAYIEMDGLMMKMGCMSEDDGSIYLAGSYIATAVMFIAMTIF